MKVGLIVLLVLLTSSVTRAQSQRGGGGNATQGSLTITATVAPSVWLVMEPDGRQHIHVANAPDPKEVFQPRPQAVQFSFHMSPNQFEVRHETLTLLVDDGGKTVRRAVSVTTAVPR